MNIKITDNLGFSCKEVSAVSASNNNAVFYYKAEFLKPNKTPLFIVEYTIDINGNVTYHKNNFPKLAQQKIFESERVDKARLREKTLNYLRSPEALKNKKLIMFNDIEFFIIRESPENFYGSLFSRCHSSLIDLGFVKYELKLSLNL